ncbi:GumC family protein [Phenylobacterium sp.]|uniref:GumC family protein n=1 Tax=Phenylobacterium sp. TaxID=1871053 RepID=UPI002E2F4C54|nr:Wzz/FepE/Etk N-terminal domain-containing protein [Phenylobacterium sp.]HEX2561564.1 Wzz/FepE/Etk N-terminal domain-containing protein [Phenylobacterium sp.]
MRPRGASAPSWTARPRYAPSDIPVLLWRERWLMAGVFAAIFIPLLLVAALLIKPSYPAYASVLVRLGQEYVYEPRAGDAGRGAVPEPDQLIQAETEILGSEALKRRVIDKIGLDKIDPKLAAKYAKATPAERRKIIGGVVRSFEQNLAIETAPDTPVIRVGFEHKNPELAALMLNTLIEEYLVYRRNVLIDPTSPVIEQQRIIFQQRLADADQAYQDFLVNNRIGDFVAEKASLSQLQAQIEQQKLQTEAQLQERTARLGALQSQLGQVAAEVGLYRDLNTAASDKLAQLRVQREDLLSRYKPDARPVQDVDVQIAQLEQAVAQGRTTTDGARRFGVNPVRQTVETDRLQAAAEVAALQRSVQALNEQLQQVMDRRLRLAGLEPRFQALALDRDVLMANVRDFSVKEEQSRAAQDIASRTNDNIRIVQRAAVPTKGKSLKRPVAALALLFAGFTALCAGLLRGFLRPGLPTPQSASRTLGLPVLGAASLKPVR